MNLMDISMGTTNDCRLTFFMFAFGIAILPLFLWVHGKFTFRLRFIKGTHVIFAIINMLQQIEEYLYFYI